MRKPESQINSEHLKLVDLEVLGGVIRKLREKHGLTQRGLAARLDCDPAFISLLENGNRSMSLPFFEALARAFNVDPKWLMILAFPKVGGQEKGPRSIDELGEKLKMIIRHELFGETVPEDPRSRRNDTKPG